MAKRAGGSWLVRMEDLDRPRVVAGMADDILRTLETLGFAWDGPVLRQSSRYEAYEAVLSRLLAEGHAYPCGCSRAEIARAASAPHDGDAEPVYPGTCRDGLPVGKEARSFRVRVGAESLSFHDLFLGKQRFDLATLCGDFVVKRADGLFAYQLAVVVDDADAGVTHVVRGADLLDSTARQIHLQQLLSFPQPAYAHLPVATNAAGEKLSKQTLARAVDAHPPAAALVAALRFLGQAPPAGLDRAALTEVWSWALHHWRLAAVPRCRHAPAPDID